MRILLIISVLYLGICGGNGFLNAQDENQNPTESTQKTENLDISVSPETPADKMDSETTETPKLDVTSVKTDGEISDISSDTPLRYLTRPELREALQKWLLLRASEQEREECLARWESMVENASREQILIATVATISEKCPQVNSIYTMCRSQQISFTPSLETWLVGKEIIAVPVKTSQKTSPEVKEDASLEDKKNPSVNPAEKSAKKPAVKSSKNAEDNSQKMSTEKEIKYEEKVFPRVLPDEIPPSAPDQLPRILVDQVRLFYGISLSRNALYDEADLVLTGLLPEDVIDPAGLLFYRAVVQHQLLQREACVQDLEQLQNSLQQAEVNPDLSGGISPEDTENSEILDMRIPRRYVSMVQIMLHDMESLKDDGLEHISRRMNDIRRRLDFGHAGEKVQKVERGVIESLDEIIEKLEEEQKKQQQQSQSNNTRPQSPPKQAQIMGGTGPGNVENKKLGTKSGWGNLPEKEREESLQQIGQDFPPHYRDAIEQYFRRLAETEN
ncbi:MAG: hypothetical protein Q4C96_08315 [Planctomycetia bacterium]|nr:hypothetical protein [Planctomycetia bacterium]